MPPLSVVALALDRGADVAVLRVRICEVWVMPYEMIGGPLDGTVVPDDKTHIFVEGGIVAADTRNVKGREWSAESVYRVSGRKLIYDAAATEQRRFLVAVGDDVES